MPRQNIKVALLPNNIVEYDTEANLRLVRERVLALEADVDLVVLPEMFNTGFTPDVDLLHRLAEPNDGPTIIAMRQLAQERNVAIWGGFTATDGNGHYYNRGFMISPDHDDVAFYDKRHLFSPGEEARILTPGTALAPIVEFRSWRLKMAICYDIRFPVWNRARANDYDALVVPANWVHARYYAWRHMLIARAIENQCYVMGCNREGHDIYGQYMRGDSMIINNWGDDVSRLMSDGTVYAVLDADRLNHDREHFAPWRDADDFQLFI